MITDSKKLQADPSATRSMSESSLARQKYIVTDKSYDQGKAEAKLDCSMDSTTHDSKVPPLCEVAFDASTRSDPAQHEQFAVTSPNNTTDFVTTKPLRNNDFAPVSTFAESVSSAIERPQSAIIGPTKVESMEYAVQKENTES